MKDADFWIKNFRLYKIVCSISVAAALAAVSSVFSAAKAAATKTEKLKKVLVR